jgi:hypothetical protein
VSATLCDRCGETIDGETPAVRAFRRIVVAPGSPDTPDLRGPEATFHQPCAPDWGDPGWISRAEGSLDELT